MPPRLSVIVPTLDEEKRLGGLLGRFTPSVRARHGLELVVTDGGSTDATLAIARAHGARVVAHAGPGRQTIAAGRNAGARVAEAPVLLFLNADVMLPDALDAFLGDLAAGARAAGAATCRVLVHPSEAIVWDRLVLGTCNALFWAMNRLGAGMGRGECHAVTAEAFWGVGGYREDFAAGEDFDLFNRIAQANKRAGRPPVRFWWRWVLWEDPRRYRARGYWRTMGDWFRNTVSITFRGRAASREWEPVR